ncbi:MAG: hypothetical protein GVY23_00975 [Spirochaetes bacterium]|nr:hypothetical protein [Spirochaetota bacterium]
MQHIKGTVVLAITLVLLWVLLAYPASLQELAAAVIVAILVSVGTPGSAGVFSELRLTPRALIMAVAYLGVFTVELIKANLDVAARVVSPSLPIRPGIVKVRTRLRSRLGRLVLANSITLTPGTITVDTDADMFYIHWISVEAEDPEGATRRIVGKFERYLEVICG